MLCSQPLLCSSSQAAFSQQRMQEEERLRDAEWDQQRLLADRAAMVMEAQEQDFRHQLRKGTDVYNRELADAQKSKWVVGEKRGGSSGMQVKHLPHSGKGFWVFERMGHISWQLEHNPSESSPPLKWTRAPQEHPLLNSQIENVICTIGICDYMDEPCHKALYQNVIRLSVEGGEKLVKTVNISRL